jgi:molybdenum cofactor cytidylyltransferase
VISALVLAAGEGTRFGGTKQLEILRDKPLVQHAVDAASGGGVDDIVVVLGHDALRVRDALDLPEGARFVVNERYADGQSTSLAAGLRALDPRTEGAVVLLADQPGIRAHHVRSLVTAFETTPPRSCGSGSATARVRRSSRARSGRGDGADWRRRRPGPDRAEPDRSRWLDVDEDAPPDVDRRADLERA